MSAANTPWLGGMLAMRDSKGISTGLAVVDLQPEDPRWAQFVAGHPDALPYHDPAWSHVLQEAFGYRPVALGCADASGHLSGVLPLFEKRSLLAGVHLSSLPHTPVAGPLTTGVASLRALLSAAASRVDQSAARWLQLKVIGPSLDGFADGFSRVEWDSTYVLDLPDDADQLRFGSPRNHSRIRWSVRKAERLGVTVREASSLADVRRWYALYAQTMRAHATPPRPARLFELIWDVLASQDHVRLLLAERRAGGQTELLAGSFFLQRGRTVVYAFNGRDRTQLQYRPNDAIHWRAIADACRAGFRRYDFGEVAPTNAGLADFKEKWGAAPVALYRYDYPRQHEVERGVLSEGPLRRTAEWTWRRLPLPATERLGRWIYRRL
jgi:CelD/BcsL family acetyltransferase involved in cellulose biosynthesis